MNHKVVLSCIFSMLMCACSHDVDYGDESGRIQGQIMEPSSRTYLDGGKVIWKANDAISVFTPNGFHYQCVLTSGENTSNATFLYQSVIQSSGHGPSVNYAVYPFSVNHNLNDGHTIDVDLISWKEQTYTENSFEDDKSFMTGKSADTSFPFYNTHSLARVRLSSVVPGAYSISSVSLSSQSAVLNGKATIDMTVERPILVLEETDEVSCKTNTLVCNDDVVLTDETIDFYILMPAGDYSDLTLTVTGVNELESSSVTWSKTYSNITFQRSMIETFTHQFAALDFSGQIKPD